MESVLSSRQKQGSAIELFFSKKQLKAMILYYLIICRFVGIQFKSTLTYSWMKNSIFRKSNKVVME